MAPLHGVDRQLRCELYIRDGIPIRQSLPATSPQIRLDRVLDSGEGPGRPDANFPSVGSLTGRCPYGGCSCTRRKRNENVLLGFSDARSTRFTSRPHLHTLRKARDTQTPTVTVLTGSRFRSSRVCRLMNQSGKNVPRSTRSRIRGSVYCYRQCA